MPETFWTVRWPDGSEERLYSPSSVVSELFEPGESYALPDFLTRARIAMERASNRVRARYGHPCSLAMGQLDRIEARVAGFDPAGGPVTCLKITQ
ncbi:hypothetical protein GCM10011360_07330 [Primorskyibacter flagellatus]|uniref:MSMEG_0570 family nitrogen starvation response protein n=1 Tax=Primorskyibacter flagellatus TaxID=1387277 RepID=A0A917A2K2_9RHOB|nr:MSMEG_0570 family nitrogen starvation response protein [Primorskyibacter flagellatus]GGE21254.1 hypothetical protein GCM10011360_07330 [Primorskyibacter flagellatus]